MRTRLAIVFCSLAVIFTIGFVFLPSSESSIPRTIQPEPKDSSTESVMELASHPLGYAVDSVVFEDNGKPITPEIKAQLDAERDALLKKIMDQQKSYSKAK